MYQNVHTRIQHLRKPPARTGGLCWIVFALKQDVLQWPAMHPETNLAYTAIKLKPGAGWYQLKVVDKDRFFSENQKASPAGHYWEHQVSGYFSGNNVSHINTFGKLPFEDLVVIFKDREGSIRFIGNEDSGVDESSNYNSGDINSSRKRVVTLSWEHTQPAPVYIGSLSDIADDIIEPPFANEGDFNNDFNDDFNI